MLKAISFHYTALQVANVYTKRVSLLQWQEYCKYYTRPWYLYSYIPGRHTDTEAIDVIPQTHILYARSQKIVKDKF